MILSIFVASCPLFEEIEEKHMNENNEFR